MDEYRDLTSHLYKPLDIFYDFSALQVIHQANLGIEAELRSSTINCVGHAIKARSHVRIPSPRTKEEWNSMDLS